MELISIMGDSISTYAGYNPVGYSVFYDEEMQFQNELNSVNDTWWAKVIHALDMCLCVNGSYSGSRVTGNDFPSAVSEKRIVDLQTSMSSPDIILVYIGFNDFGHGIQVFDKGLKRIMSKDPLIFANAYKNMLTKMTSVYPKAKIVCGTLMRTGIKGKKWLFPEMYAGTRFEDYNAAIRKACKRKNCFLADLGALDMRYETLDGSHPTAEGHKTIANAWIKCLAEHAFLKLPVG